jgi:AP-3 complex subunit beta
MSTLDLLTRYVRNQFTDPALGVSAAVRLQAKQRSSSAVKGRVIGNTVKRRVVRKAFYSDEEDEFDEEDVEVEDNSESSEVPTSSLFLNKGTKSVVEEGEGLDADHRLVLRSSLPLLKSRNAGVVLSVCALHYYCGSHNHSITQNVGLRKCTVVKMYEY